MKQHTVLGTAGHIDHGKTALVKALTNMDTDRLQEEQIRGMTIDLGFAYLGDNITIIDVPGHEKFIRNMVAGVSTIDLVLFIIAADDGIMPQTIEHLEILNLLQIKQGLIVLTKIDLVEEEWLELVEEEIHELTANTFLAESPVIRVSSITQQGIPELKQTIQQLAATLPPRPDKGIFRLPIDRIFTIKGFGTVAAGTVLSGSVRADQSVDLLPQQKKMRIRGLQIHGKLVDEVSTGDRAAINLSNIEKNEISRGDVLAEVNMYHPTIYFDAKVYLLKSAPGALKHNSRVRLHLGTCEIMARIRLLECDQLNPGDEAFIQLRCEQPMVAEIQDRFVIRRYSPIKTIGGGTILQTNPPRHKRFSDEVINRLKILEQGDLPDIVEQAIIKGNMLLKPITELTKATNILAGELQAIVEQLAGQNRIQIIARKNKQFYVHKTHLQRLKKEIITQLELFHNQHPLKQGVSASQLLSLLNIRAELFFIQFLIQELKDAGKVLLAADKIRLADYKITLSTEQEQMKNIIEDYFISQEFSPPHTDSIIKQYKTGRAEVEKIIAFLLDQKILIYIDDGMLLHQKWVAKAREMIISHFDQKPELSISELRTMIGASRKYSVPILNYFDQTGLTTRQDDVRVRNES